MKNRMFVGGLFIVTWLLALGSPARASLTVTNGPQLWLDAGVGVQTSGTGVTNWLDQSGKGNHASQGVAAATCPRCGSTASTTRSMPVPRSGSSGTPA
jgi:hypothetical protein